MDFKLNNIHYKLSIVEYLVEIMIIFIIWVQP